MGRTLSRPLIRTRRSLRIAGMPRGIRTRASQIILARIVRSIATAITLNHRVISIHARSSLIASLTRMHRRIHRRTVQSIPNLTISRTLCSGILKAERVSRFKTFHRIRRHAGMSTRRTRISVLKSRTSRTRAIRTRAKSILIPRSRTSHIHTLLRLIVQSMCQS